MQHTQRRPARPPLLPVGGALLALCGLMLTAQGLSGLMDEPRSLPAKVPLTAAMELRRAPARGAHPLPLVWDGGGAEFLAHDGQPESALAHPSPALNAPHSLVVGAIHATGEGPPASRRDRLDPRQALAAMAAAQRGHWTRQRPCPMGRSNRGPR